MAPSWAADVANHMLREAGDFTNYPAVHEYLVIDHLAAHDDPGCLGIIRSDVCAS
jgi:hypothetical protein